MSDRPEAFAFQLFRAFTSTIDIQWSSGNLVVSLQNRDGTAIAGTRSQATPSVDQWTNFWRGVEFLEVWSWKEVYADPGTRDGQSWSLHMKHGKRSVTSEGENCYPSFASPTQLSGNEERFGLFLILLRQLLASRDDYYRSDQALEALIFNRGRTTR